MKINNNDQLYIVKRANIKMSGYWKNKKCSESISFVELSNKKKY